MVLVVKHLSQCTPGDAVFILPDDFRRAGTTSGFCSGGCTDRPRLLQESDIIQRLSKMYPFQEKEETTLMHFSFSFMEIGFILFIFLYIGIYYFFYSL